MSRAFVSFVLLSQVFDARAGGTGGSPVGRGPSDGNASPHEKRRSSQESNRGQSVSFVLNPLVIFFRVFLFCCVFSGTWVSSVYF